jgi:hypothetical protein
MTHKKIIPVSYSRLNTYEQCPARFDYQYVSRRVQDVQGDAAAYGDRVHKTLEVYGRKQAGTPLRERSSITALNGVEAEQTLKTYGPAVDRIMARRGDKYFEHEMAVNLELQPVKWDAPDVWIRSIADVLIVDGHNAYCLDYKTGKVKDDPTQLRLFAAMVFWHFPEVTQVKTSYIWLKFAEVTNEKHQRNKLDQLWASLKPRFDHLQATYELGVYKTKPGPLCDPWCPARNICPDAKLKRK